jgi:hypothetical protein
VIFLFQRGLDDVLHPSLLLSTDEFQRMELTSPFIIIQAKQKETRGFSFIESLPDLRSTECTIDIIKFNEYMLGRSPTLWRGDVNLQKAASYHSKLEASKCIFGKEGRFRIIFEYGDDMFKDNLLSTSIRFVQEKIHCNLFKLLGAIHNDNYHIHLRFIDIGELTLLMKNYTFGLIPNELYHLMTRWVTSLNELILFSNNNNNSIHERNSNDMEQIELHFNNKNQDSDESYNMITDIHNYDYDSDDMPDD